MKGKPWTVEEEKQLKQLLQVGKSVRVVAGTFGKTQNAIRQKMIKLELKEEKKSHSKVFSSSDPRSKDLPSVEEALQKIDAALVLLESSGLDQAETLRLRSIVQGRKMYIEKFAEYLNYRELETRLIELEGKYAALTKKAKNS